MGLTQAQTKLVMSESTVTVAVLGKHGAEDSRHKWLRTNSYDRTVRELSLFAQNTEWIYRSKHLPLVRSYSKKITKGFYDDDLALEEILGSYVPFLITAYKSQFGKDSIPRLDKRTEQALANELLDLVIYEIMERKGVIS